ncbi:MAG: hypothetical protein GY851_07385, partial [bacterium]|nr:hypothetical protein [bacterium]
IADAPLGGIAGRPCYLYAIIVDEDGVPLAESGIGAITDAAMVRHGRVGARVSRKDGTFKIKCSPWWDWLNQKVRKEPAWATLRGYHFTRGDDTTQDQYRGHLVLWEITDVGGDNDMNKRVIWLCAENSLVSFDTREELLDALQQELLLAYEAGAGGTTATGSDGTSYVYQVRPNGLHHDPTAQPDDSGPAPYYASFLGGPVAWALNLGPPNSNAMSERDDVLRRGSPWPAGDWASSPFPNWTWLRRVYWSTSDEMPQAYSPPDDNFSPYKPLWITWEVDDSWESVYYYQMDWNPWSGLDTTGYYPEWRTYDFLIPGDYYGSPGPSLYLDWSTSVSNFNSAEDIVIGAADRFLKDQPTRSTAAVSSLNTAANKIVINPGGSWSFPDYTISTPHFSAIAKHVASRASGNETESCFAYGGQLCYVPAIHDESAGGDPWPVHQTTYIEAQLASDLFKALLGDDSGELDIQEIFEFNNIPDAVDLDANGENEFYETIDWDSFDQIVQPPFPNSYYSLDIEGADINLYALLSEVLKLHGACATWEYDANKFQYVMKFRKIGVVNVSSANFSGRKINVDNRQIYATPSGEHSGDRLVSAVRARFNWNDGEGKYLININVDDEMNASATGGRRKEITIADKVTHIAGYSSSNNDLNNEIMRHFVENHLIKLAWPLPAQTVRGTLRCSMESPCGSPVLITDPAAFNMYTGAYGLTAHPGLVTGLIVDFKTGECGVTYRVSPGATKDWAPSVRITDSTISSNDVITVVTGEWDTSRYNTLVDNMTYFGNFTYNSSTGQTTQVDTDPYLCTIYEEGKNGMVFEKVSVAVNAGVTSVTLTLTDIGLTWSTSDNYIMTFGKWGDDLHDTQRLWLYMAQDDGTLDDGATVTPGQEWE